MGGSGRIIQLEILGCLLHNGALNLALASQAIEHCDDDGLGVDVEVAACALASIGEAEAIRTQGDVGTRDVRADLLLQLGGEVRDANERTLVALELGGSKCLGRLLALAQGLLVAAGTVAGQFVPEVTEKMEALTSKSSASSCCARSASCTPTPEAKILAAMEPPSAVL